MKRKTEKDYYDLATSKGFKWIGPFPKTTHHKTWWECEEGHRWEARYNHIHKGSGCPVCNLIFKRKTKEDYYNITKGRGFKWAGGKLPLNALTKTWWVCEKGHKWESIYNSIQQGVGCPFCSGNIRKVIKDYYSLAKTRGFKWIGGQLPSTTAEKTLWECSKGHKWESTYGNIYAGYNCPYCSGKIRKTKEDYHELAKSYGFKWIGDVLPKSNKYSTLWECEEGHVWKARYNNIYNGYGCPYCQDMINGAIVSKPQRKLNSILHGSLNYPEGKRRIDVAIMRNSKKIAVEYDCWYWHQGREEQDAKRDSFLVSRGWKVIHIKSGEMLPIRKQLKKAINKILNNEDVVNIFLEDWKT